MKLLEVKIKNFRSIKEQVIKLTPSCRVLVGINESGKSNILKALELLDEAKKPNPSDVRFPFKGEQQIDESVVRFEFKLDTDEIDSIYLDVKNVIGCENIDKQLQINTKDNKSENLQEFIKTHCNGLLKVNIQDSTKTFLYYSLPQSQFSIGDEWFKPTKSAPSNYAISLNKKEVLLNGLLLVHKSVVPESLPQSYLEPASVEDIHSYVGGEIVSTIKENIPECVYWSYNEKNLLPASIAINAFSAAPSSCVPLQNIFELAGVENIQESIATAQLRPHGLRNLLERIADKATQHIKSIWKEYKSIEILLEPNGPNIDASVKESFNRYDFASRSDGFKRFVSFLIMVSAKVKTNQLENTLILIDEPEIGLHPTGARYLRDELIKIAERNTVVYSTHSIFMVDKNNIGRHLLISKIHEETIATEASPTNFADEEVLYNALGYSIFENLNESNLIFEGWRDKRIFEVAMEGIPKSKKQLKAKFQNFGIAHLQGVADVGRVSPILDLGNRKYIIVSDCDQAAKSEQKKFTGAGKWLRWDEISDVASVVTGEDFVKSTHIKQSIIDIKDDYVQLDTINVDSLDLTAGGGRLHCIEHWIGNAMQKDEKREFLNLVKGRIVESLTGENIEDYYYIYLEKLADCVS